LIEPPKFLFGPGGSIKIKAEQGGRWFKSTCPDQIFQRHARVFWFHYSAVDKSVDDEILKVQGLALVCAGIVQ
jgi:hypothetical protein